MIILSDFFCGDLFLQGDVYLTYRSGNLKKSFGKWQGIPKSLTVINYANY